MRILVEGRIVVTFGKDFGELAFGFGLPASSGIILFRIATPSALRVAELVVAALETRADWAGHFAVVEEHRVRMTQLPGMGRKVYE